MDPSSLSYIWINGFKYFLFYGNISLWLYLFFSVSEWQLLSHVWIFVTHNCSPPSSSIHGISQASILEWVAIPFYRGSFRTRDQTQLSLTAGEFFTICVTREGQYFAAAAAAAAKSLQSCPTLCDLIDGCPPGSPIPGILQARTLEWVAISFSNA